jgi:predicted RNA-binding protein associated with RNAse of E/G family
MGQQPVTVEKLDLAGQVVIAYEGVVREWTAGGVVLEAVFTRGPLDLGYVRLNPGDRFVEHFYTDRWYNVFAIYDAGDGGLKGWYCNITRPAEVAAVDGRLVVRAVDLALDYFRQPGGAEFVLDEDEFSALALEPDEAAQARRALEEVRGLARRGAGPFGV